MKKFFALSAFALLASIASADTITVNCTTITASVPPASSSGSSTCAGFTGIPLGATISNITLTYALDFQYNKFDTGTPQAIFAIDTVPGGTGLDASGILVNLGNRALTGTVSFNTNSATGFTAPFTVNGSWVATTPPDTGVTMDFQYVLTYSTGAPEPATLGLMGTALVGLGFLARRKK